MNKEFEFCNIPKWHEAGIKGDDCRVGIMDIDSDHRRKINIVCEKVIPEATIINYEVTFTDLEQLKLDDLDVLIISLSEAYGFDRELRKLSKDVMIFVSAGNYGADGEAMNSLGDYTMMVSAYEYNKERPTRCYYSSYGKGRVDIAGFSDFYIDGELYRGTSFSNPLSAALFILFSCAYKKQFKLKPTVVRSVRFIKEHCIDLEKHFKDLKSGYGLFILPDEIDLSAYKPQIIEMIVGERNVIVDGVEHLLDTPVKIEKYSEEYGRVLIELRFFSEFLGWTVVWKDGRILMWI